MSPRNGREQLSSDSERLTRPRDESVRTVEDAAAAVMKDAASVVQDAAAVAESAAAAVQDAADRSQRDASEIVRSAAEVVEDAAAVVQDAAAVVHAATLHETLPSRPPDEERRLKPRVERRLLPRLPKILRHEAEVHGKHIAVYVAVLVVVLALGGLAIWSFIEKQSMASIEPAPLPKVTLVTADPRSPLTASWVRLLTAAEMQPTLVPVDRLEVLQGVVAICDLQSLPPKVTESLNEFVRKGGAVAVLGAPPQTPLGNLLLVADGGDSDGSFKFSESVSPILSRLNPGYEIPVRRSRVAFLQETARMNVDARWSSNSRAVIMHMERGNSRYLWFGFNPDAVVTQQDRNLLLLLRTAFRWVAGQPVSDGAVGDANQAMTFTPNARRDARAARFSFSVDPLGDKRTFSVEMSNRGPKALVNPTVRIWLPPGVTGVRMAGDPLMHRHATLTGLPEEGACLVTMPRLGRNESRVMKIKITSSRE